ncbi:MAG: protoheme IX farnesyltransferase [Planctomycetes bacterium]|nr:protoheme IX farnesyltransferase [Planctomycetota bacterium]
MSILERRTTTLARATAAPSLLADLFTLTKPRITGFVALAAFVGAALGAPKDVSLVYCAWTGFFVMLCSAGASAFNQTLERDIDRAMERTRWRPMPTERVSVRDAILLATFLGGAGVIGLALLCNLLAALLALATLFTYVAVYTPLKRYSTLNTVIGALPGAAPPLVGYVATAEATGEWAWALFAVLFVWQFPHFLAIAWLFRDDYRKAGLKMLPAMPGGERVTGRSAFLYSLVLLPVSLGPVVIGIASTTYLAGALASGAAYTAASAWFALRTNTTSARTLLVVSLFYLPVLFACVLLDPLVRERIFG